MPSLNQIFRTEILRLARKEVKAALAPFRKDLVRLKRDAARLKRESSKLTRDAQALLSVEQKRIQGPAALAPEAVEEKRVTGVRVMRFRKAARLTQGELAQLLNVSTLAVGSWERKGRKVIEFRGDRKAKLLSLLSLSGKEARRLLSGMVEKAPAAKKAGKQGKKARQGGKKKAKAAAES